MPFVFVHGVNNRQDSEYLRAENFRNAFLRELVAPTMGIEPSQKIFSPYWGGAGVKFWKNLQVIPVGKYSEKFGGGDEELFPSLGIATAKGEVLAGDNLVTIARRNPALAIDLLFDAATAVAEDDKSIMIAHAYNVAQQRLSLGGPQWLENCSEDDFLKQVVDVLSPAQPTSGTKEVFGGAQLWSLLDEALQRVKLFVPDQLSHAAVGAVRRPLTASIASFIGDALQYLSERGDGSVPGRIARIVLDAISEAAELARQTGEPLVIISHSFGGEIVYDVLTHYAKDAQLQIDAWVTVGSQVGLFEEMSMLWNSPGRGRPDALLGEAIPAPQCVKQWLNITDTNDVLGFLVQPVFTGIPPNTVQDFNYNTSFPVTGAHSGYFRWPSFYKRLAARLSHTEENR